jgi:selenocysteine-specific elongation factor
VLLEELEREPVVEASTLVTKSSLGSDKAAQTLLSLLTSGQVVVLDAPGEKAFNSVPGSTQYVLSASQWEALLTRMRSILQEYHQRFPLRGGMPREELKSRMGLPARTFIQAVVRAATQGVVTETETTLALGEHRVVLSAEQQEQVAKLWATLQQNPYSPPGLADCEAMVGGDVLAALLEQGKLAKVSDSVLFSVEAYQLMRQKVIQHLQREGRITLAQVRDMFATSRKYAQALLEHLDDQHVTKRIGDERVLR